MHSLLSQHTFFNKKVSVDQLTSHQQSETTICKWQFQGN